MKIELNLQALIPDLEMCQGSFIETKIFKKVSEVLYAEGQVNLYDEFWSPQHVNKIVEKCKEKGYVVYRKEDKTLPHYVIQIPEFIIAEKPIAEPQEEVDDQ
jgi:hypothetical protein